MSPTDHNPAKPLPLAQQSTNYHPTPHRTHSPHIIDQALARKPLTATTTNKPTTPPSISTSTSASDFARYNFDPSPTSPSFPASISTSASHSNSLEMDPSVRLEPYDWDALEAQFAKRMEAFKSVEE